MNTEQNRYPDIVLERYALGELDPARTGEIDRRLRDDEALRRRLDALRQSDREILARYPSAEMERAIRMKIDSPREMPIRFKRRRPKLIFWKPVPILALAGAALAVVIAFLAVPRSESTFIDAPEIIRYKGDPKLSQPSLSVFRLRGNKAELLKDGSLAARGDTVQLHYNALAKRYGVILSLDGRGTVTLHYPLAAGGGTALETSNALLPRSFELDDAPLFERFFFVTADAPFDLGLILERAKKLAQAGKTSRSAALDLPAELTQTSVLLVKENN